MSKRKTKHNKKIKKSFVVFFDNDDRKIKVKIEETVNLSTILIIREKKTTTTREKLSRRDY